MEQRGRIAIGGVFFKYANRRQMRDGIRSMLDFADKGEGVMLP